MGQKSNTLTLRTNKEYLNSRTLNSKEFWESAEFINTFKRSLEKKGVTVTYSNFNTVAKTSYLSLDLFYKTHKLLKYKKKSKNLRPNTKKAKIKKPFFKKPFFKKPIQIKKKASKKKVNPKLDKKTTKKLKRIKAKILLKKNQKYNIIKTIFKHLIKNELIILKLKLLNKKIDRKIAPMLLDSLTSFKRQLFSRRFNLFFDFLKLSSLFIKREINLNAYAIILGTVFKFLPKRSHSKFFVFVKKLLYKLLAAPQTQLKGIKIIINGKLKGKLRSSTFTMSVGKLDSQTIASKMEFSRVHINTLYGCFGLKLWANYK